MIQKLITACLVLLAGSCQILPPEVEWEDVRADYEPRLNILGILSSDSLVTSFVRVHRTLRVDEAADTLMRDTVFGGVVPYYASRFVVRDAKVTLNNGTKDYDLQFKKFDEKNERLQEAYVYNGDDLIIQPGTKWTLSVTEPGGLSASGATTVPPLPEIDETQLPDSFNINQTMDIVWTAQPEHYQLVNVSNLLSHYYIYQEPDYDNCGFWQKFIATPGETAWNYRREPCDEQRPDKKEEEENVEDFLLINIMSMDTNYYNYILKYGGDQEFASLFLGQGGSGQSFGVVGGMGFFGAIEFDRHYLPIVR